MKRLRVTFCIGYNLKIQNPLLSISYDLVTFFVTSCYLLKVTTKIIYISYLRAIFGNVTFVTFFRWPPEKITARGIVGAWKTSGVFFSLSLGTFWECFSSSVDI